MVKKVLAFTLAFLIYNCIFAQAELTPYDGLPGMVTNPKPSKPHPCPDWLLTLYQYPAKIDDMQFIAKTEEEIFRPHRRYSKLWMRTVPAFIREDGLINRDAVAHYEEALEYGQLLSRTETNTESADNWEFVGPIETFWLNSNGSADPPAPCPWQANVYALDIAQTNKNIIYAGTETGFLNKSTDNGLTWSQKGKMYNFGGGITAIAVHPFNENRVWAAAGNQIHYSADGGDNWQPMLQPGSQFQAFRLEITTENQNRLLASTNRGIYISNDLGQNWNQRTTSQTWDAHSQPGNPNLIHGLTESNGEFEVLISDNGGTSFRKDLTFPSGIQQSSGGLISVSGANENVVRVILLSDDHTPLLYEKNLMTSTWRLMARGKTPALELDNGQGYYDLVFETSPTNSDVIYAGTTSLFISRDGGQSFTRVGGYGGPFPIHPDIQDMKILDDDHVWVATDGGLTYSTDQFQDPANAVARNNGLVGSDMWGFDQGWNEDIVVGGRYHNGNTAIADFYQPKALRMGGAESPTGWVMQGKSRHVTFNDLGNGWILPASAESQPKGRFIFSKYPNMDEYGGRRGNMVIHPQYYGHLFLGEGNGFWQSKDMGVTFELLHDFGQRVRFIQVSLSSPNVIYADIVGSGLHRSEDGGYTWEAKPSLTSGTFGSSYWNGKLHFVISPTNRNHIYACLNNGTWSRDVGKIFESTDGGDTWQDITYNLEIYSKALAIQLDPDGNDVLYVSGNAENTTSANVYFLDGSEWKNLGEGFPAGFSFNHILPFYRDGKLRAAGNGGIWSHSLIHPKGLPLVQAWVEKAKSDCFLDTLEFDCHSMANHDGLEWKWTITPTPSYISDPNIRNPKIVLGSPGSYDVTLELEQDGISHSREFRNMVTATTCPSIEDCNNPAYLDKSEWSLLYVDSEEINFPGRATMAFDDDPETIWHTRWSTGTDPYPHEIQIDLGDVYEIHELDYLPRQVGVNGRIKDYEVYLSMDNSDWGSSIESGQFVNSAAPQKLTFTGTPKARYLRIVTLSEVNDGPWTSIAELDIKGCIPNTTAIQNHWNDLKAHPVPTKSSVHIPLNGKSVNTLQVYNLSGQLMEVPFSLDTEIELDFGSQESGFYFIQVTDKDERVFVIKVIVE